VNLIRFLALRSVLFEKRYMKTNCWLVLAAALSTNLFAQPTANPAAPAAGTFPPPSALSKATLEKISRMTPLFDGKTLEGWKASVKGTNEVDKATVWTVKDGAMASLGAGRGVLYTEKEFGNYRVIFTMRHVSGQPDHQACVLIFCTAPPYGQKGLDALGGIQFQPPNGGSWDYRPGKNNSGKGLFTRLPHPKLDAHEWSQVELLVNAETGTARMAVAQPIGTKAVEVLDFKDPTAGKKGPIAWQMHNKGLFDEYKDVRIEVDPKEDNLITVE
jgi:hypothetical protein